MQNWSWNDYDIVRRQYPYKGKRLTEDLPGRSTINIESKADCLRTYIHSSFTPEEIKIAKSFGKSLHECIIFLLPDRSISEIEELLACVSNA